MAKKKKRKLMCGEVEVTLEIYHYACVLLDADDLKKKGIVEGGPEIANADLLQAIRTVGKQAGMPDPSDEFIRDFVAYFGDGGEWEKT